MCNVPSKIHPVKVNFVQSFISPIASRLQRIRHSSDSQNPTASRDNFGVTQSGAGMKHINSL